MTDAKVVNDEPQASPLYKEFRKDGWPYCPNCELDELYSPESKIETIRGCYACGWRPPLVLR